jgi:hypothetical protein
MHKVLLTVLTLALVSTLGFAEMKLKLKSDFFSETNSTIINNNLESNLNLNIAPEVVAPPLDMKEFVKGMIILGILADASFPLGGEGTDTDPKFGHIAGTGFSGHIVLGYIVAKSWLLTLRGGYIKFGEKTGSEDFGFANWNYTDNFSQIPILIGAYYLFNTPSAFKPYIGLALGIMIQNYKYEGTGTYEIFPGQTETFSESADKSSTGFGLVPSLGTYYLLGSVMIQLAVEYNILFGALELTGDDYAEEESGFYKINNIAQEEEYSESYDISYFSVLLGVSFPLGQ